MMTTLNRAAIGAKGETRTISWTSKDAQLYAVGIGAGAGDLPFSTENTGGTPQRVYPSFAVVAGSDTFDMDSSAMRHVGSFDPAMVVHGSQAVNLHRPIPVAGEAMVVDEIVHMWDKGKAAVIVVDTHASSPDGDALWTLRSSAFIRGAGGFGGERVPSAPGGGAPGTDPDHLVTYQTSPDQAYVYRLSGDRNPLHSDPALAAAAGFDRPVLHGLCTYGFTCRALLRAICADDVERFTYMEGRFSAPVLPGDTLDVRIWRTGADAAAFTTSVGDRVVIDQGRARFGGFERSGSRQ